MRRITGEEKIPMLHRLDHEAAHLGDALLRDRAFIQLPSTISREAPMQLLPDARIGPLLDVLVGLALQIQARELRRAHALKREAVIVIYINELIR